MLAGVERAFVAGGRRRLFAGRVSMASTSKRQAGFFNVAAARRKLAGHAREVAALFPVDRFLWRWPCGLRRKAQDRRSCASSLSTNASVAPS